MNPKLCILSCHNFHAEVDAGVTAEGWDDVVAVAFPARCGRPPVTWDELRTVVPDQCTQVVVLGRACLSALGPAPADWPPTQVMTVTQCFHLVAGETLVDEAMAGGAYLLTPTWLADWRGQVAAMGFSAEQADGFFRDFARELLFIDTGLDPQAAQRLAELQQVVTLPVRRIAVGLDTIRPRLARLVLEWRLQEAQRAAQSQQRQHAGELADHVAAMDMLLRVAKTQDENAAVDAIEELFQMLFAPAALHYLRVENAVDIPRRPMPEQMRDALRALRGDHAWTSDEQGFLLRIAHGEETLGLIAVDRLAYVAYRERYLNLALALTGVCGLAIVNARNRKRLLEAEKMASLSILVAGVAHEVNTPLGVGLTAASSLQAQSRLLAEHFAARSMTQSELSRYLEAAGTGTALIRQNLERISHLVDAFRQVAVEGRAQESRPMRLRNCIDDVLRSLGERIAPERVTVAIDCAADLEIVSIAGDWASIFVNLVNNSLTHGFKGRDRGEIKISVRHEAGCLHVDYRDDGNGMPAEALARIFDPFYTTDLQHGMGLGMHLVYNLVTQRMGGRIQCESSPGNGVCFFIEIPS